MADDEKNEGTRQDNDEGSRLRLPPPDARERLAAFRAGLRTSAGPGEPERADEAGAPAEHGEDAGAQQPPDDDGASDDFEPPGPFPFDTYDDEVPPGERLAAFLLALHDDLHTIVYLSERLFSAAGPDPHDVNAQLLVVMRDAWAEIDLAFRQQELLDRVRNADVQELAAYGLSGRQLDFKLIAWHQSRELTRESFVDSDDSDPGAVAEPEPVAARGVRRWFGKLKPTIPRQLKIGLRRLSKALSKADIILGSLAAVVPGVDMVKEFKEAIEEIAADRAEEASDDT